MTIKDIAAIWKKGDKPLGFRLTAEIKQKLAELPEGCWVNVMPNVHKKEDRHPDYHVKALIQSEEKPPYTPPEGLPF